MKKSLVIAVGATVLALVGTAASAECFGEGAYRVCTDTYTDSRGNTTIRSYDTQGNTYSVNTELYRTPGGNTVRSRDSMGNRCTITRTGKMIGCGQ